MTTRKYTQRKTLQDVNNHIATVERFLANKYPGTQGKLIWDILAQKIDIQQSITDKQLDEQLAAKIRTEYPQHVKRGT